LPKEGSYIYPQPKPFFHGVILPHSYIYATNQRTTIHQLDLRSDSCPKEPTPGATNQPLPLDPFPIEVISWYEGQVRFEAIAAHPPSRILGCLFRFHRSTLLYHLRLLIVILATSLPSHPRPLRPTTDTEGLLVLLGSPNHNRPCIGSTSATPRPGFLPSLKRTASVWSVKHWSGCARGRASELGTEGVDFRAFFSQQD